MPQDDTMSVRLLSEENPFESAGQSTIATEYWGVAASTKAPRDALSRDVTPRVDRSRFRTGGGIEEKRLKQAAPEIR